MAQIPAVQTRSATVAPKSLNAEARTVDLVWSTGARVLRGFFDKFFEELSLDPKHVRMGRLTSGRAPVLAAHEGRDLDAVVGVVERARLDGGQGVATVRFADDPKSDGIFRKIAAGILRNVSVGYTIHKAEQVEAGNAAIPVYRATDWEPFEISIVPSLPAPPRPSVGGPGGGGVRLSGVGLRRPPAGAGLPPGSRGSVGAPGWRGGPG
jgi:hypothetical protein